MIGLILSLIAASISFILLLLDKKENKKTKVILTLATIGFLTILGQQFLSYFSSKASDQIFKNLDNRTKIIDAKATRIDSTVSMLEVLLLKLDSTSASKIGIAVNSLDDLDRLKAFEKGDPHAWRQYREWLIQPSEGKKALKFIVNVGRHYNYSLILLYLITDRDNQDSVRSIISSSSKWSNFPQSTNRDLIEYCNPLCDLVIFENERGEIVGFCKTKELIDNIMSLVRSNSPDDFEKALNDREESFDRYAKKNLPSFQMSAAGKTLEEVSSSMIKENIGETVTFIESQNFYFSLSSLFEIK